MDQAVRELSYAQAIQEALAQAMDADPNVFLMGEDVGRYGGSYGCSKGLLAEFGEDRIRDTPLSEGGFTGAGIGAQLMDWALGVARERGHDAVLLSVYSENFGAQRFYQRYGFGKIADITFPVGEQLDEEFLYELKL